MRQESRDPEDVEFDRVARELELEHAETMAGLQALADEVNELAAETRAELEAGREEAMKERKEEEAQARAGQLGSERQALQRRIDAAQTTWEDILLNRDTHPTAQAYRDTLGTQIEAAMQEARASDPEFDAAMAELESRTGQEVEAPTAPRPNAFGTW